MAYKMAPTNRKPPLESRNSSRFGPLASTDRTLEWYARAVAALKTRRIADPTSWRYQAGIHEYVRKRDPLADRGDVLPSAAKQKKFWTRCQHGSWFFLPWHRMYLHYFESILMLEVAAQGGPTDWALPYWNYSQGDPSKLLPAAFRSPTWTDPVSKATAPNPLYVAQRDPRCNAGQQFADELDVDVAAALGELVFMADPTGGASGFGGPQTRFEHLGKVHGALEHAPHDLMHNAIAGPTGWMGDFTSAPLDPIFYLHHANVDRLWQVWLQLSPPPRQNPVAKAWLSAIPFAFHDATGAAATMVPRDVLDTAAAPLRYVYDDLRAPAEVPAMPVAAVAAAPQTVAVPKRRPEMVGATTRSLLLGAGETHAVFEAREPTGPALKAIRRGTVAWAAEPKRRVLLNVENIKGKDRAPTYDVYLTKPSSECRAKRSTRPPDR
jgi:tyrosinase